MKHLKLLAAAALLLAGCAVSYYAGYHTSDTKNYEAACLQADFIRYIIDDFDGETEMFNIGAEIENSYEEYFLDLDNQTLYGTKHIKSIKDFDEYYWSY